MIVLGVAILVRTSSIGGGEVGIILGDALPRRRRRAALRCDAMRRARWPASFPACAESSTRGRSSRSPTARSRRRSTSRSGSSRCTRRLHAARAARSRRLRLPARLALLRRGDLGAARDRRRGDVRPRAAYNDLAGLHDRVGALPRLPDRDRALRALRPALPRGAFQIGALDRNPWDVVVGVGVIVVVGAIRLVRRPSLYTFGIIVPALDVITQLVLIALRLRPRSSRRTRSRTAPRSATRPTWQLARLRAPARDARLHRARDRGEPRRGGAPARRRPAALALPRDRDRGDDLRRDRRRRALGVSRAEHRARDDAGCARRSSASPTRSGPTRSRSRSATRSAFFVGVSGALILLAAVTTSISRLLPARLLARRARPAAARLRPPAPAHARLAAGDRQRRR